VTYVINKAPQGTEEWLAARVGLITGSRADMARKVNGLTKQQAVYVAAMQAGNDQAAALMAAGYKKAPTAESVQKALAGMPVGEWGDSSKKYAFRLAVERITGKPLDEGFQGNFFSRRGKRLEEEARMLFELRHDCIVEEVGLIHTEDRRFGVSADGWVVDSEAGIEIKCFLDPSQLMPMLLDDDFDSIRDQCLMNLWLSGRKVWHQILYVPALEVIGRDLTVHTIDRRAEGVEDEITRLEEDLMSLDGLVEHYRTRLLAGRTPAEILADEEPQTEAAPAPAPAVEKKAWAPEDLVTMNLF
jgi:hypothetical protein